MKNAKFKIKKWTLLLFFVSSFYLSRPALALDPTLTIVSPSPGEVVASETVNAIIDTDVAMASDLETPGFFIQLWLDTSSVDPSRAIATVNRGYIFERVPAGLHTLRVAITDRAPSGEITKFAESVVDFEVSPPQPLVSGLGPVSWFSLVRDGVIFSFPIIALALLLLWMMYLIRRK